MDSGSAVSRKRNKKAKSDASIGIMDSEGVLTRNKRRILEKLKSDMENTKEPIEEKVPKILSPEIYDVFHVFVNMLDMKSFIKLAMTSKQMHKRCTENKSIRINVDIDDLFINRIDGPTKFTLSFSDISSKYEGSYLDVIRKFPCDVRMHKLSIQDCQPAFSLMPNIYSYLKEIKVNKINELTIYRLQSTAEWETLIAIFKDFGVKIVKFMCTIESDRLSSILQLNLARMSYNSIVHLDFILEIKSSIGELAFPAIRNVPKEHFMDILSRIHSGFLPRLKVHFNAVNWDDYNALSCDHEGPLPEDRPLLLARTPDSGCLGEYWFVHWHGGVTKCVADSTVYELEIFKCEPWEYPWILRKEEDVLLDLAEKRSRISCSASQFHTFTSGFTMIDRSRKGPLPKNRPLYCKVSENHFLLLEEDDSLTECTWEDGSATWKPLTWKRWHSLETMDIQHPALAKYIFWKVLEQSVLRKREWIDFECERVEQFNSWLKGFQVLESRHSGSIPSRRPLIFGGSERGHFCRRIVLLENRLLDCHFTRIKVHIKLCHYLHRPPALFSADHVAEMLKDVNFSDLNLRISLEAFLEGLHKFKKSTPVLQNRVLILETSPTEFWYRVDETVRKVVWEEGRLIRSKVELNECPPDFMKQVFRNLAEATDQFIGCRKNFILTLEQFNSCLEQFTIVPFDYSGQLKNDSAMAFVKKEICHRCRKGPNRLPNSKCEDFSIHVWFLWEGTRTTRCSWGRFDANSFFFGDSAFDLTELPLFLKSKECLQTILKAEYDKSSRFTWFGASEDLMACVNDYVKLPFDYDGPLPEKRPLYFGNSGHDVNSSCFILREDGTVIKYTAWKSSVAFSLAFPYNNHPPALRNIL